MKPSHKSLLAGAVSAAAVYFASMKALGYTFAIAVPAWLPAQIVRWGAWEAVVVFGVGALLPAFAIQWAAIRISNAQPVAAATGFAVSLLAVLLVAGQLATSYKAFPAWIIGALLACQFRK